MTAPARSSAPKSVPESKPLRVWFPVLVSVVIACGVFGVAFWREIVGAVTVWVGSTAYNHCFLVLPLAAALLWSRREIIGELKPRASPRVLAIVPFLSVLWVIAALLEIQEVEQLLIISLFEVLLLSILGWQVFRALLAPLLFLAFLVPFGAFTVPVLQRFTASFAVYGLQLLDIPVFANGFIIEIPEGVFEVAEACAGLRFLIASIVFGCFFATVMYRNPTRRMVFIGLSIFVPIIANGFRALGIIVLGHIKGSAAAAETDHVLYGWIFFSLVTVLLIAVGMTFAEPHRAASTIKASAASPSKFGIVGTMVGGLLLTLIAPAYLMMIDRSSVEPATSALAARPGDEWAQESNANIDWSPVTYGTQLKSLETYRSDDTEVSEFIALYPLPARASPFTSTFNSVADPEMWHVRETGRITLSRAASPPLVANTTIIEQQSHRRLVWWFYVVDDQMTASTLEAKLLQALVSLRGGGHVGAFMAISTEAEDTQVASAALTRFLEEMVLGRNLRPARIGW